MDFLSGSAMSDKNVITEAYTRHPGDMGDWLDGRVDVHACIDGQWGLLFSFYTSDLSLEPRDVIGLTAREAHRLKQSRSMAALAH